VILAVIITGTVAVGFTVEPGVRLQIAFAMVVVHEIVTLWLKEPVAVI